MKKLHRERNIIKTSKQITEQSAQFVNPMKIESVHARLWFVVPYKLNSQDVQENFNSVQHKFSFHFFVLFTTSFCRLEIAFLYMMRFFCIASKIFIEFKYTLSSVVHSSTIFCVQCFSRKPGVEFAIKHSRR